MANEYWRKGITKVRFSASEITTNPTAAQMGSGTNEQQTITITGTPTGGSFTLTFEGQTTAGIAFDANAAAVDSALEALSNIGVGEVAVTGGPGPGTPWVVTFSVTLGAQNLDQMTATSSLTGGTTPAVAVTTNVPGVVGSTDLSVRINAMDGWETQVERIPTENLDSEFTSTITGPRTVGDASITFLDQKDPTNPTPADYDSIRTLLELGVRGTLILCPYGAESGSRCELWPVESSGPNDMITLANEPAKYRVDFGITGLPVKTAEIA